MLQAHENVSAMSSSRQPQAKSFQTKKFLKDNSFFIGDIILGQISTKTQVMFCIMCNMQSCSQTSLL